jgi:steroid delta-isomerase-like uncharacterized protein
MGPFRIASAFLRAGHQARARQAKEIVRCFYDEVWNRQDSSAIRRLCDEEIEFRGSLGAERRGHEGFAEYVRSVTTALAEYHCAIQDIVAEDNEAFARMLFSGVHRGPFLGFQASGRRVEWAGAALFTIHEGRIKSLWVLGDLHGLINQLSAGDASVTGTSPLRSLVS